MNEINRKTILFTPVRKSMRGNSPNFQNYKIVQKLLYMSKQFAVRQSRSSLYIGRVEDSFFVIPMSAVHCADRINITLLECNSM